MRPHCFASEGSVIITAPNNAAPLKRSRIDPVDCQTAQHVLRRSRPSGIKDEDSLPVEYAGKSSCSFDDFPMTVVLTLKERSVVRSLDFHPVEKFLLLVGTNAGEITLWDLAVKEKLAYRTFNFWNSISCSLDMQAYVIDHTMSVNRVIWSPDGYLFGVAHSKNIVHLYSYSGGGDLRNHLEIDAHVGSVNDLAFSSPNEQLCVVTCGDDRLVKVWAAFTGVHRYTFEGHEAPVYSVCPHRKINIQFILSAATDGTIKAWLYDSMGSRVDYDAPGHACTTMAYTADGTRLFSCGTNAEGDSYIVEWNECEGAVKRTYAGLGKCTAGVVQFDTTKNQFLVAGDECMVKFWDMDDVNILTTTDAEGGLPGRCNLEDRISLLPDEILVVILSSLELKDAAATSVLSRRWRSPWTYITHLKFNAIAKYMYSLFRDTEEDETLKFIDWVNQVLQLHRGPSIEEFMVWFYLDDRFQTEIDKWLQFALAKRVQRLELHLSDHPKFMAHEDKCSFPCNMFHKNEVPFLDKLHFNSSTMHQSTYVGFQSLKSLSLTCVNLSGNVVEHLLSICSVLEHLCILGSGELVNLKVVGPSLPLKFLKIGTCLNLKFVEICNSIKLVSFAYAGRKVHLLLKNVPSLVDLCFYVSVFVFIEDYFSKVSCCFSYLETLTLSTTNFEKINTISVPQKLNALKKFVLHSVIHEEECFLPYTSFIKASPILQKFVLQGVWALPQIVQPCVTEKIEIRKDVNCAHKYLKEVQLVGYYGRKNDLELVIYFLENAVSLKKIVIDPCDASNHYMPKKRSLIE